MMKKLLLTGFGPFGNHQENPSQDIVLELNGQIVGGYQIVGMILPVSYEKAGKMIVNLIESENPDAVISLGLAGDRTKVTPELVAINYMHASIPDNEGLQKLGEPIHESGKNAYFTTLPIQQMIDKLQQHNIPSEMSTTAGSYVCNLTKYHILHHVHGNDLDIPAGFIHIPNCLTHDVLLAGIKHCIVCL
jgi:pyroglutamyl-peptidase